MVTNETLSSYYELDAKVKELTKERDAIKKEIADYLQEREGKSLITHDYMAYIEHQKRKAYVVAETEYDVVKVKPKIAVALAA